MKIKKYKTVNRKISDTIGSLKRLIKSINAWVIKKNMTVPGIEKRVSIKSSQPQKYYIKYNYIEINLTAWIV
jgi:hypothetical protein